MSYRREPWARTHTDRLRKQRIIRTKSSDEEGVTQLLSELGLLARS